MMATSNSPLREPDDWPIPWSWLPVNALGVNEQTDSPFPIALLDQVVPVGGGFTVAGMALANRWITTRQLGVLLGFMPESQCPAFSWSFPSNASGAGSIVRVKRQKPQTSNR